MKLVHWAVRHLNPNLLIIHIRLWLVERYLIIAFGPPQDEEGRNDNDYSEMAALLEGDTGHQVPEPGAVQTPYWAIP